MSNSNNCNNNKIKIWNNKNIKILIKENKM